MAYLILFRLFICFVLLIAPPPLCIPVVHYINTISENSKNALDLSMRCQRCQQPIDGRSVLSPLVSLCSVSIERPESSVLSAATSNTPFLFTPRRGNSVEWAVGGIYALNVWVTNVGSTAMRARGLNIRTQGGKVSTITTTCVVPPRRDNTKRRGSKPFEEGVKLVILFSPLEKGIITLKALEMTIAGVTTELPLAVGKKCSFIHFFYPFVSLFLCFFVCLFIYFILFGLVWFGYLLNYLFIYSFTIRQPKSISCAECPSVRICACCPHAVGGGAVLGWRSTHAHGGGQKYNIKNMEIQGIRIVLDLGFSKR